MRALLSVADRDGITSFARDLLALGVEVYATDGTREHLAAEGVEVASVGELTSLPSLLGGQVKTFHPAIYAGILARRDRPDELAELAGQQIGLLDIVVVNVRPFAPQVGARLVPLEEAVDMIDVGGVALLSAAGRNFAGVAAVSSLQLSDPDVRSVVIRHEHPEFEQALKEGRREIEGADGPMNPRLHLTMHEIVATQLWDDTPPEVWDTAVRLWTQATSDTRSCTCSVVWSATRSGRRCTTSVPTIASVTSPRYSALPGSWERERTTKTAIRRHDDARKKARRAARAARQRNRRPS